MSERRLVSIVGPGGIGKTTVARHVLDCLSGQFTDAVGFADLTAATGPESAAAAICAAFGIEVSTRIALDGLVAFLRTRRFLLVLDNCEHVIEAAALLAERLLAACPAGHVLATSREALRVDGEMVHCLAALDVPPREAALSQADIGAYPALSLFVARLAPRTAEVLDAASTTIAAEICRRLDGIPFAIELAAAQAGVLGIAGVLASLTSTFASGSDGRRTAIPRHRTLTALLDWSYNLLTASEQLILRAMAVFAGDFTMEAASVVAGSAPRDSDVVAALGGLAAKSMLASFSTEHGPRLRLLDTTRRYALVKRTEAEAVLFASRHGDFCRALLRRAASLRASNDKHAATSLCRPWIDDIRAALAHVLDIGNDDAAVDFTIAALPVLVDFALFSECETAAGRALTRLPPGEREGRRMLDLNLPLAIASFYVDGNSDKTRETLRAVLSIAEHLDDATAQMAILETLFLLHIRMFDLSLALLTGRRLGALAALRGGDLARRETEWTLTAAHHFIGDHIAVQHHARRVLGAASIAREPRSTLYGAHPRPLTLCYLARSRWIQGFPSEAIRLADEAHHLAEETQQPAVLAAIMLWSIPLWIWVGDLDRAAHETGRLRRIAEERAWAPHLCAVRAAEIELTIRMRGVDAETVTQVRNCITEFARLRFHMMVGSLLGLLAETLAGAGRFAEARAAIAEALLHSRRTNERVYLPELFRLKACVLDAAGAPGSEVDAAFRRALAVAEAQGARAWTLRVAISRARRSRTAETRAALAEIVTGFTEGFETSDLLSGRDLLDAPD